MATLIHTLAADEVGLHYVSLAGIERLRPQRQRLIDEAQAGALGFITEEEYDAWLAAPDDRTLWEWVMEERQYRGRRLEPAPDPACYLHGNRLRIPIGADPLMSAVKTVWTDRYGRSVPPPACTCPQPKAV